MDKDVLTFAVTVLSYIFLTKSQVDGSISETYYLTRDCQYQNGATGISKGVMRTRVTSAQILSHQFGKEPYPSNFSCEVYLSTRGSDRFLVWFNHLYIPDVDQMCENVLHCFNTNTPISEGMQEAGGQTGLCKRDYPKQPLVTTAHYFTFTFRSKPDKLPADVLADSSAGFRLTVTSVGIPDAKTRACSPGATKTTAAAATSLFSSSSSSSSQSASSSSLSTSADGSGGSGGAVGGGGLLGADEAEQLRRCTFRRAAPPPPPLLPLPPQSSALDGQPAGAPTALAAMPLTTWCLPIEALCDGLTNCPDGTDEQPVCRRDVSLMSRLLSLGVAASVAMGVGAVALGMACVLGLACCCYRALSSEPPQSAGAQTSAANAAMTTLYSPGQAQHLLQQQHRLLFTARQSPASIQRPPSRQTPPPMQAPPHPIIDYAYAPNSSHYSLADGSSGGNCGGSGGNGGGSGGNGGGSGRHYQKTGTVGAYQHPQQHHQRACNSTEQLFGYGQLYQQQMHQNPYHHQHHHQHQHQQAQCRQHHPPPASHHGGFSSGGGGGSRTPTSSRSAKSGRSGRSSYGPGHQIRPVPPPSRADSETGGHQQQQQQQSAGGSRDIIVYPVQL